MSKILFKIQIPDFLYRIPLKTLSFNEFYNKKYDYYLSKLIDSGITNIEYDDPAFYINIEFNAGKVHLWNENKYYAWLRDGCIDYDECHYEFSGKRPSVRTIYRLKKGIEDFFMIKEGKNVYSPPNHIVPMI